MARHALGRPPVYPRHTTIVPDCRSRRKRPTGGRGLVRNQALLLSGRAGHQDSRPRGERCRHRGHGPPVIELTATVTVRSNALSWDSGRRWSRRRPNAVGASNITVLTARHPRLAARPSVSRTCATSRGRCDAQRRQRACCRRYPLAQMASRPVGGRTCLVRRLPDRLVARSLPRRSQNATCCIHGQGRHAPACGSSRPARRAPAESQCRRGGRRSGLRALGRSWPRMPRTSRRAAQRLCQLMPQAAACAVRSS